MKKLSAYKEIALKIEQFIIDANLQAGERLPSAREFAKLYNVSKFTVFSALDELKYRGTIESKPQSGFFVSPDGWESLFPNMPDWGSYMKMGYVQDRNSVSDFIDVFKKNPLNPYRVGAHFGANAILIEALERVIAKKKQFDEPDYDYRGSFALRKAICAHVRRYGISATPEEILITNGGFNSMSLIKFALMRPGMNLVCDKYFGVRNDTLYSSYGIERRYIETDREGITPDSLREVLPKSRRSLMAFTEGTARSVTSEERKRELLKICYSSKTPILEYDINRDFLPESSRPMKSYDPHNAVIYLGDLTRLFLGDFRFGWVVAPVNVINKLADLCVQTEGTQNTLTQAVAMELLGENGLYYNYLEKTRPKLTLAKAEAIKTVKKHMQSIATWTADHPVHTISLEFNDDIDVKKMFENRGDLNFLPSYFMDPKLIQNIILSAVTDTAPVFEKFVESLAALAQRSRR